MAAQRRTITVSLPGNTPDACYRVIVTAIAKGIGRVSHPGDFRIETDENAR